MISLDKFNEIKTDVTNDGKGFWKSEEMIKNPLFINEIKVSDVPALKEEYDIMQDIVKQLMYDKNIPEEFENDIVVNIPSNYEDLSYRLMLCYIENVVGEKLLIPIVFDTGTGNYMTVIDIWDTLAPFNYTISYPSIITTREEIHLELESNNREKFREITHYEEETYSLNEVPIWNDWNVEYIT